jgi:hypothetical protein
MAQQAMVTVRGIEITLTKSMVAERANVNTLAPAVTASTTCECGTSMNYGAGVGQDSKAAVKGLFVMIDQHGPSHERFMQAKAR